MIKSLQEVVPLTYVIKMLLGTSNTSAAFQIDGNWLFL